MKIANYGGRLSLVEKGLVIDVEETSSGRFSANPATIYDRWEEFVEWADSTRPSGGAKIDPHKLCAPSPSPRQVICIGLNYREHAIEIGLDAPAEMPPVFTKFVSSISGAMSQVALPPGGEVDWEVELVVVIGRGGSFIEAADAWRHVAGLSVGQDLSDRSLQFLGPAPQFSIAKSFAGFGPMGPWLVTPDEFPDKDNLSLGCSVDGEIVQTGQTIDLVYGIPRLIETLSQTLSLFPGDVIFTGTPPGVGMGRSPARFLKAGEELVSWVEGIGEIRQTFISRDVTES